MNTLYGGTKQEMERLLEDAEKLTGKKYDVSNFSDITEAIHAVQTEMGITGTTAKEASGTIQGSLGAVKSSWQNLLTGFADGNRDMGELMDNFVDSVGAAAKNIIPRVKQAVKSITSNLGDLAGKLVSGFFGEKTGAAVKKTVDTIMNAVQRLLKILEGFSPIIETVMTFISELVSNILPPLMSILETLMPIIEKIVGFVANVLTGAVKVLGGALKALEGILKPILDLLSPLFDLLGMVGQGLGAIGDGIGYLLAGCPKVADNFEEVMNAAEGLSTQIDNTLTSWDNFVDSQDKALQASMDEVEQIGRLKEELDSLVDENGKVKKGYEDRAEYVANELSELTGKEIKIVDGQIEKYDKLGKKIEETMQKKQVAALDEYYTNLINEYGNNAAEDKYKLVEMRTQIDNLDKSIQETSKNTDEYNRMQKQKSELMDQYIALSGKMNIATQAQIDKDKLWTAVQKKDWETVNQISRNRTEVIHTETGDYIESLEQKIMAEGNALKDRRFYLEESIKAGDEASAQMYMIQVKESEETLKVLEDEYNNKEHITKDGIDRMFDEFQQASIKSVFEARKSGEKTTDALDKALSKGKGAAIDRAKEVVSNYSSTIRDGAGTVTGVADSVAQQIGDHLKPEEKKLNWIGEMILKGVEVGMRNRFAQRTASTISDIGTKLLGAMQRSTQVGSPSKFTIWLGEMLGKGLEIGWTKSGRSAIDMINKDMRFSGSMDFSTNVSHNSIVGELLKYVKSIDKKSGKSGNVYFNGSRGDNIDDFSKVLSRQVIMARRV